MSREFISQAFGFTQFAVGLSANVSVPSENCLLRRTITHLGGQTLALVRGQSIISSLGMHLPANVPFPLGGAGAFYLAATGATVTVGMMSEYSAGASL